MHDLNDATTAGDHMRLSCIIYFGWFSLLILLYTSPSLLYLIFVSFYTSPGKSDPRQVPLLTRQAFYLLSHLLRHNGCLVMINLCAPRQAQGPWVQFQYWWTCGCSKTISSPILYNGERTRRRQEKIMNCKSELEGNMCPVRMMNVYGTVVIKKKFSLIKKK